MNRRKFSHTPKSMALAMLVFLSAFSFIAVADTKEQAKAAFMQGVEAFSEEDYPGALAAFEKSYRIRPKASVLYNIGMCQKALYRYSDSLNTFNDYLKKGGARGKPERKREVKDAMAEMQQLVGKLELNEAPKGAEVFVNGKSVGKTPFDEAILLDPGRHTIEVRKKNYESLTTDVTSASGSVVSLRAALAPAKATLKVECEEEKGLVFVDEKTVGGCPYEGEIEPGKRIIAIEAPNKKRFEKEVEAVSGSTSIVSATLEAEPGGAAVAVVTQPSTQQQGTPPPAPAKSTRRAWQDLNVVVKDETLSKESRIKAIDEFLANYTVAKRYVNRAHGWKKALAAGVEPESYNDPGYMRTQKEYFSLKGYFGTYGGGARIDFSTRRWKWFYLGGFLSGGGGAKGDRPAEAIDEDRSTRFWGTFGLSFGVPWHIGKKRHHEIRTGMGIAFGAMSNYNYKIAGLDEYGYPVDEDLTGMSVMFIFVPEIYYVWHAAKRFALQVGGDVYIGPFSPDDFTSDSSDTYYSSAPPVFNVFIGFRI